MVYGGDDWIVPTCYGGWFGYWREEFLENLEIDN